jgi:hypothetical protein
LDPEVHVADSTRFFVGMGSLTLKTVAVKFIIPEVFTRDASIATVGVFWFEEVPNVPPAKALTTAAMTIVTTSISITPTTGDTASLSFFFENLFI